MSFMLTTEQMYQGTKDITRRDGWWFLKLGDIVMACEKCQGLGKGGKIKRIRPIRVLEVGPEPLDAITAPECAREGFPEMTPVEFVDMFSTHNKCSRDHKINRIVFEHIYEQEKIDG